MASENKAIFYRCVRDKDAVAQVPPYQMGFAHPLHTLVFVSKENKAGHNTIMINPKHDMIVSKKQMKKVLEENEDLIVDDEDVDDDTDDEEEDDSKKEEMPKDLEVKEEDLDMWEEDTFDPESKYAKTIKMVPRSFRDHMPEFYLQPMYRLVEAEEQAAASEE
uniref:Uncharacterized protein n=1 Tax=Grammatophora oceanica TaxID=210454 RepID=A0A7S1VEN7_9STRA